MRSTVRILGLSLAALGAISCAKQQATIEADYVFENINVIPLNEEVALANKAVAVRNGEIVAILNQSAADNVEASMRVDGAGQYLLPGLADMHIHMRMDPHAAFNLFLANGVTTVLTWDSRIAMATLISTIFNCATM